MANSKPARAEAGEQGEARYPYTTKPGSLRKFLQQASQRPKPPKVVTTTLKTWGFKDANDASILRVLKAVGLLADSGEPTDAYASFMKRDSGPSALGIRVRETYKDLFDHIADPVRASNDELTNFFNINSGGAPKTIQYQVQTFKALADNASFSDQTTNSDASQKLTSANQQQQDGGRQGAPVLHIDLHIHLPENKNRADYDLIFSSIAEHILGKQR